jgi:hypothetical protein
MIRPPKPPGIPKAKLREAADAGAADDHRDRGTLLNQTETMHT